MSKSMEALEVLRAVVCVAAADRDVNEAEERIIRRLSDEAGVGKASLTAMYDLAKHDPKYVEDQLRINLTDPETTLNMLFRTALADDVMTEEELNLLRRFAQRIGISDERFAQYVESAQRHLKKKQSGGA